MFKKGIYLSALFIFVLSICSVSAQGTKEIDYEIREVSKEEVMIYGPMQIEASSFKLYKMDVESIQSQLKGIANRNDLSSGFQALISFPHPDGRMHEYKAYTNTTMSEGLAEKYPQIIALDAIGVNSAAKVKWDVTEQGFHAMIFRPGKETIFIDPAFKGNTDYYIVYLKKDFQTDKRMECTFSDELHKEDEHEILDAKSIVFGTCELRTYRLALSGNVEYSTFHGGTKPQVLSAQVTSMNRVNGVFERDMAITMTIVPDNDKLIFLTEPDGFTNSSAFAMLGENQDACDDSIGTANYDIGHVFGRSAGGVANYGSVCDNFSKAKGVTGGQLPIGDPFDIDYVAHEMGHQFAASHTFRNSCGNNVSPNEAMEPGSGSTIMAYAGICSPNVQTNSDDYFHGVSLKEMHFGFGAHGTGICAVKDTLQNNAPTIVSTTGDISIPAGTPFYLSSNATDIDGDTMTFCWEQMNNEWATQPPSSFSDRGPNFRSLDPSTDSVRYFPNYNAVLNGQNVTWEVLSDVGRTFKFRLSVRDNAVGLGSCTDYEDIDVVVYDGAGPFEVLDPSSSGIEWIRGATDTVYWDVANTDLPPVSCDYVDILLSVDGGQTFPYTLASNTINSGSAEILVPDTISNDCRVMVRNVGQYFYNLSENDFTIREQGVGMDEIAVSEWNVYPNPSNGMFNISLGEIYKTIEVEIHNSIGQIVLQKSFSNSSDLELSFEGSPGVYLIHVTTEKGERVFNLMKE